MPTAKRSNDDGARRAVLVLIAWNLPWFGFTAYAAWIASAPGGPDWVCPVDAWLGACPGCGLTTAYADLLRGRAPTTWLIAPALLAFAANAAVSLMRSRRVRRPIRSG
jgi:hypothetical protein